MSADDEIRKHRDSDGRARLRSREALAPTFVPFAQESDPARRSARQRAQEATLRDHFARRAGGERCESCGGLTASLDPPAGCVCAQATLADGLAARCYALAEAHVAHWRRTEPPGYGTPGGAVHRTGAPIT